MAARRRTELSDLPRRPPATTPDGRENQLIELANDVAEIQMREGVASSQVITHFLKLGSSRERLEQERIEHENALLEAKKASMEREAKMEDLFAEAIKAMKTYQGEAPPDDEFDD